MGLNASAVFSTFQMKYIHMPVMEMFHCNMVEEEICDTDNLVFMLPDTYLNILKEK